MKNDSVGLYIHLPFCTRKCRYCDFTSFEAPQSVRDRYIRVLRSELGDLGDRYPQEVIDSVYIGGGTPSVMRAEDVCGLCDLIREIWNISDDAEITIEVNPGSADRDKLTRYLSSGINRLSIGAQSFNDPELATLGRIHDSEDIETVFLSAREAGFDNISLDLISAIPGQTFQSLEYSLRRAAGLLPEHISVYSLTLEEGTYMYEHRDEYEWVDEDTDLEMYHMTADILGEYGYDRYEVSNYSRPGASCRHNLRYWRGGRYIGAGLGAASYMEGIRSKNTSDLTEYFAGVRHTEEIQLSLEDRMEEFMFLGLRETGGVSKADFKERFNRDMTDVFGDAIASLRSDGLLTGNGDGYRLTESGFDLGNYCFAKFLL